jgi:DNA-binding beta-propeller fold protein YncE
MEESMRNARGLSVRPGLWRSCIALSFAAGLALCPAGASGQEATDYEIWALDQGTQMLHIYSSGLEEVERVDLGAQGIRVPHMIDFTSDHAYAFIASTGSGDVTVIRTADREIVAKIPTGPGTHMAAVKPDDSAAIAAVIGVGDVQRDGKLVEIVIGADGTFTAGRELVIAEDPLFMERESEFKDVAAVCHEYSPDGRLAFVTLGPALDNGGLVVLDTESFTLTKLFPPAELSVNCGTALTADGKHMLVNGGGAEAGHWYVLDLATQAVVHEDTSRGQDAHGVWATPDGREVWMVNRVSDDLIVIDPTTFEIVEHLAEGFGDAPDILAMSPDSRFAFISLRGPKPVSAPHVAVGTTPGFAVVDIAARRLVQTVQPNPENENSDFHGIGVRVIHD